ncbi:hypothetical protein EI94DRAFT_1795576 [Lactarius quietus]|nr:hypothetical protein EI94DRAFT_1795576 [Lactarius quietus]
MFTVSSSPIKSTDCEDLSLAEMSQRMKKRARQSNPHLDLGNYTESQKVSKRPKNTHVLAPALFPDSDDKCSSSVSSLSTLDLDSLISLNDETNNLHYLTPFNLSPVNSPTAPDPMSPVPRSRRQLSRIGSRNLKENKNVKRLASPFHSRSASRACSRSSSRANSPKMKIKKPPFYIKARTRSEANVAQFVENVSEVLFPISGSLPTLGSMKSATCDSQNTNCSTTYMLQNLSELDWFRPAKALSHSPFSEDYVPPGTPFHAWEGTSEAFLGGFPLQTSTPIVTNDPVRGHAHTEGAPSAPNTPDNIPNSHDITMQTCETKKSCSRPRRQFNHDSIFSSYVDGATVLSTLQFDCMGPENALQDDIRSSNTCLSENGQMDTNLSGMLDSLDINGMLQPSSVALPILSPSARTHPFDLTGLKSSPLSLAHRSRSLDSAPTTVAPILPCDTQPATGRKRDRASTIRASDYMIKPTIIAPCGRETSMVVAPLTTRTRSGTIRPAHPPSVPLANSLSRADLQRRIEQASVGSSASLPIITDRVKKLSEPLAKTQGQPQQVSRTLRPNAEAVEETETDVANDESDDELLLDGKGWNWDGRWE